ncbi:MYND domain [Cordyceps militaris]|uniref:MYND domain n=1 Tax=Cordyceps militaris TaxID=73501 RepID=A0A2H4SK50_CORMI|nr:MYND domain [Cordyceps militaris]
MSSSTACASCSKSPPEVKLKHCAKCPEVKYCGRVCQTAHWPAHRAVCVGQTGGTPRTSVPPRSSAPPSSSSSSSSSSGGKLSPAKGVKKGIASPFTQLDKGTWLHNRAEADVYALLIDAYRLRAADMYNLEGEAEEDSIQGGAADGLRGFQRFLGRVAAARPALLPPWWDASKKTACEDLGMRAGQWSSLRAAVEKSDLIEHYGDSQFPMQLRMFAEAVYGKAPGGSSGSMMKAMMMAMESGDTGGYEATNIDLSKILGQRR